MGAPRTINLGDEFRRVGFFVYRARNKINGKSYIGKTCMKVVSRFKGHHTAKSNSPFHRAIRKYGWENFEVSILYEGISDREIYAVERAMIAQYGTMVPNGYNLTIGGEGSAGIKRPNSKLRGRKMSDEARANMSSAQKGLKKSPKALAALKRTAHPRSCAAKSHPIYCVETGEIWTSKRDCARSFWVINSPQLYRCINSPHRTYKGLHFRDVEEKHTPEPIKGRIGRQILEVGDCYAIEYESIQHASDELKIPYGMISRVVSGSRKSTHGRVFIRDGERKNISTHLWNG